MAASRLQELAAMRNLTTCELDKRRHLVTDVRTSKRHMANKNDRPLILSDKNRGNVDRTCHQTVIYDVTVNNCYL